MLTKRQLKHSLVGSNKPCRKKRRVKVTTSICYRVVERGGGPGVPLTPLPLCEITVLCPYDSGGENARVRRINML